jgi:hypothetical protein
LHQQQERHGQTCQTQFQQAWKAASHERIVGNDRQCRIDRNLIADYERLWYNLSMKRCWTCNTEKPLDEFGNNRSNPDGKQGYCKDCSKAKDKTHYLNPDRKAAITKSRADNRRRNMLFLLAYLSEHPCVDCGEEDPIVLDFDHVKGEKSHNISAMAGNSLDSIKSEIEKCEVRCANCHRRKTSRQFGFIKHKLAGIR